MKIIFSGDLMLGGELLNHKITSKNFEDSLFYKIKNTDYIVSNLENAIIKSTNREKDKDALLYCSLKTFDSYVNLFPNSVFCLGNNHIDDFGKETFTYTKKILSLYKIPHYGAGLVNEAKKPLIIDDKLILLNFSTDESYVKSTIATENKIGCIKYEIDEIKQIISKIDLRNKILIITLHWGYEYIIIPSPKQVRLAHKLIDLGADMVVGHHPHIIQPFEIYKDKYIFYSLGNYFFPNFYKFKSGTYHRWSDNNNRSILIEIEIINKSILNVEILGLICNNKLFKLIIHGPTKDFLLNISDTFLKIVRKNGYDRFFEKYLKTHNLIKFKSTFLSFIGTFFLVMNFFSKNKFPYIKRIKKMISMKKLIKILRLVMKNDDRLDRHKQELYDIFNFCI